MTVRRVTAPAGLARLPSARAQAARGERPRRAALRAAPRYGLGRWYRIALSSSSLYGPLAPTPTHANGKIRVRHASQDKPTLCTLHAFTITRHGYSRSVNLFDPPLIRFLRALVAGV